MKLRWVAVAGQLTTIIIVALLLGVSVQMTPLLAALCITLLSNVGFTVWLRTRKELDHSTQTALRWNRVLVTLMILDLAVLTALLYFTGGHSNPFLLFYFVNLALSGILLPARWAWFLNALSVVSFGALFYFQVPLEELRQPERLLSAAEISSMTLAQLGLLVAFAACSSVIVYFATRLTTELKHRDYALLRAEMRQARSDKWEALGTLAAGAAHELASPLTTIAVVCKEIERELEQQEVTEEVIGDVRVIREELDRCRGILDQMSTDAGHITAEKPIPVQVEALLNQVIDGVARINLRLSDEARSASVTVPPQSFGMALRGLVQNGLDASPDKPVDVDLFINRSRLCIEVTDQGSGMSKEVLARADEPFFSTKEAGKGMGLGRFLARSIFERLDGSFVTDSTPDIGTKVTIQLPIDSSGE
ncbi:MAG: ATP-binding protein [Pseudomonadota bacterium]